MSSTGDVSSYSNSGHSGYDGGSSGSSLANTTHRKSLVMQRAPYMELALKIGHMTKRSLVIDSPLGLDEKLAEFKQAFLDSYHSYVPIRESQDSESDIDLSGHFLMPQQGGTTSTPNIARALGQGQNYSPIVLSGGTGSEDLFKTPPVVLASDTDQSIPMEQGDENRPQLRAPLAHPVRPSAEYRSPLAYLQEVEEEIVSEDSLSESFQESTKLNSSFETLACSLDMTKAKGNKKTLPHQIQATPTDKLLPTEGIFEGLRFVLTYDIDAVLHNSFSKDVTKEQIEAGGGEVLSDLVRGDDPRDTVLISDFSSSTKNYLMALVLGVPCVTYIWIESCCRANVKADLLNLHPEYYLDRGKDVLTQATVVHNPTACRIPFTDCPNIYLQGSKNFKGLWADIIRVGGGIPRLKLNTKYHPDIVVTEGKNPFSQSLKTVIEDYTVPVVTSGWLQQTVITGELADIDTFADLLKPNSL